MEDLLKKISQYQLFNFLLSGTVLAVLLNKTTSINLIYENIIIGFFAFYFLGLVISRVGSLIVEPVLKKLKIIEFVPYDDYLSAVKADTKIDTLSQENNTYRTLIATFLVFVIVYTLDRFAADLITRNSTASTYIFAVLMLLLFIFAYRKQTDYITERVRKAKSG
ncbi:MAG: hypothetical protein WBP03_05450 [Candidatus Saccharimonadales bacterium]